MLQFFHLFSPCLCSQLCSIKKPCFLIKLNNDDNAFDDLKFRRMATSFFLVFVVLFSHTSFLACANDSDAPFVIETNDCVARNAPL